MPVDALDCYSDNGMGKDATLCPASSKKQARACISSVLLGRPAPAAILNGTESSCVETKKF
jgi:hypothetical protein